VTHTTIIAVALLASLLAGCRPTPPEGPPPVPEPAPPPIAGEAPSAPSGPESGESRDLPPQAP
jgi:hypothetical protein